MFRNSSACNEAPPLTVRANPLVITREALQAELAERYPEARACRFARHGIVLGRRGNPSLDPAFREGRFTVQDEASQLVVGLLDPQPGERVLDSCAAPGGKSTAIAECVGPSGSVLALDRNERRLDQQRDLGHRLQPDRRCVRRAEYRAGDVAIVLPPIARLELAVRPGWWSPARRG